MLSLNLAPSWATHYEEFWLTVRARNLWFIKLRFGAVVMLLSFILALQHFFNFNLSTEQIFVLYLVTASLFLINIFFFLLRRHIPIEIKRFSPLHFSLLQITTDISLLMILVYFTGTIESPLFFLFVFHMIVASLILPGRVVYSIAGLTIAFFFLLTLLEYFKLIPHHAIPGLLQNSTYNNYNYVLIINPAFAFTMIVSVALANKVARQLYLNEQKLLDSIKKLETAEIEKQNYVLGITHEIKTPVAAIHSILNLVLDRYTGPISDSAALQLNRAKERADEAVALVNNILKISKLKLLDKLDKEQIEIGDFVTAVYNKFIPLADEKKISFMLSVNQTKKIFFEADKFLFELALSNLLANAIKYTDKFGSVQLSVVYFPSLQIVITDTGMGIPQDQLGQIFSGYFRADNIRKSYKDGSGVGLATVKQILEKHGYDISVVSPVNTGDRMNPGTKVILQMKVA